MIKSEYTDSNAPEAAEHGDVGGTVSIVVDRAAAPFDQIMEVGCSNTETAALMEGAARQNYGRKSRGCSGGPRIPLVEENGPIQAGWPDMFS